MSQPTPQPLPEPTSDPTSQQTPEPDVLLEGEIVLLGRYRDASNVTLLAEAQLGGAAIRCIYKPIAGERPLWDFPTGSLAAREVAAYLVSEGLGWGIVPRTVLREGPHGPGMVQVWVEEAGEEPVRLVRAGEVPPGFLSVISGEDADGREVVVVHEDSPELWRVAVFDIVINNADRKGSHVLATPASGVMGVDHGVSFHVDPKLRTVLWGFAERAVPEDLLSDLEAWAGTAAALEGLAEHLDSDELMALTLRVEKLLRSRRMPAPRMGGPSIPWPPL